MTGLALPLDATRLAGTLAFAAAALACLRVAMAGGRRATLWRALAAVHLVCLFEVVLGLRYDLHIAVNGVLQERGWYASRGRWQAPLLVGALALMGTAAAWACWRHRADPKAARALAGTAVALSVFATETLSLHRIDAVLYAPAGPLLVIGWLWLGAAALVIRATLGKPG